MINPSGNGNLPEALSLLIAAHCSTIQRKTTRLDAQELSAILDDLVRELNSTISHPPTYFNSLNEIILSLNSISLPSLISINSHYFFILVRNTIQVLLQQLYIKYQLNQLSLYVLRNCTLLLDYLVKETTDVSQILHWITDATFVDALADCLNQIEKISKITDSTRVIKQISRLLNIFSDIQKRLPLDLHESLFVRLLQPVINCLTSSTFVQLFKALTANSKTLTAIQKLFLVECPHFLISYNGPGIEKTIEQVLETMLPRYVSILNSNIKTIKNWQRPMKRVIYHLLRILIFAEGYFTLHLNKQLVQTLIDDLLRLINEPILINNIRKIPTNRESLLIDAALQVFSVLVYEPSALDYIKQRKSTKIFQRLISTPCEAIVLNAYTMLAYTIDENNIKESKDDLSRLLRTTLNLLYKAVDSRNKTNGDAKITSENIDRNIMQLTETLRGLVQHDELKNELLKQNALPYLLECSQKISGLSKQFLLECLWTLSFDKQTVEQIRQYSEFILSLQNIPKLAVNNNQENTLHRSNSRLNNALISSNEAANEGIYKMADGLLWNLIKESQFRENAKSTTISADRKYKNDIMISYCYNDKQIVYKIEQFLINEGFDVWLDRDILHRQKSQLYILAMETVAEAIDKSALIIICLSDSYKRDNHCQAEVEYAHNSKRIILPLIVRKGYEINGWLTSIIDKNASVNFDVSDFKTSSSLLIKEINQHYKRHLLDVKSRTLTPRNIEQNTIRFSSDLVDKQTVGRGVSTQTTPAPTPISIDKQQQILFRSNSRSITPGMTSHSLTPLLANGNYQKYLPEEYTKRNTSDSTYRSISINIWKKKDVLDFLYDLNLNLMMPLCETMTGPALIRFYRICQTKPSRVYSQLNNELYSRFRGVNLPMGVYTQFLIEIDNLIDTGSDSSQVAPSRLSNDSEYLAFIPIRAQSRASSTPYGYIPSPARFKSITPMETIPESTTPKGPRVIERAVFRPASSTDPSYDLVVESGGESTALLQQVERYANHLLFLNQQRSGHREINGSH